MAALKGVQALEAILEAQYLEGWGARGLEESAFRMRWRPIGIG